jgi:thiol-disulfide isomerase/thioredoxin
MEEVTSVTLEGHQWVGDIDTHHLKFVQSEFDWEMWFAADGPPSLVQARFDMSKIYVAAGEKFKNGKMLVTQHYKNWQFDVRSQDNAFVFVPPDGSKKLDSVIKTEGGEAPEKSPLIGKPAPDIEQSLLDGGQFSLKQLKGQKIVILDFWATWCGPCVREMPVVAKIAEEYREKDVVLYCLNQQEEADTIRDFLKENSLKVTVSLDANGEAGEAYGAEAIPLLVLVDKSGIVQSVHTGFSPDIADKLKEELDGIIGGENLAAKTEVAGKSKASELPTEGLEEVWSKPGRYSSVAVTADGKSIVALRVKAADFFDVLGEKTGTVKLPAAGPSLRCARLSGSDPGELLSFGVWGTPLTAHGPDGALLWKQAAGIDDVWAADLDRDGKDEVIVGYNGRDGLHVFNGNGERRWKTQSIGNVWHVAAGDLDGDGTVKVVTTSAAGKVHVFDAEGQALRILEPGIYANMVRVFRMPGDSADGVLVIGGGRNDPQMVALNGIGGRLWQIDLPATANNCLSLAFASGLKWAAASFGNELAFVIDVESGKIVAVGPKRGSAKNLAWVTKDGEPLLLIASTSGLSAWRVKP